MKQKLLFFFLTAFLSLIGGGELWAEQVTFNLANGSSSDTKVSHVSLSTSGSFQTDNDKSYRNGLRIDAGGYIELTADAGYSISKVQITFTPDDNNDPISSIRSSSLTSITINTDETTSWGQTFSNKGYTTYGVLERTLVEPKSSIKFSFDGNSGSVYVKQLDVTYSVDNRSEIAVFSSTNTWPTVYNYVDNVPSSMIIHGPQNNSSSNFVIKIVATNEEVSSGTYSNRFDINKLHVSVEDPTVITLGTVYHQNYSGTSGNRQQMYFSDFTILKEGSTRIVVSFDGDEHYLPKTVYYDITTKNIRHSSLYSSYPFTWDFANNDWESSKIQMAANSTDWASYSGEGRSKQSSVSATSGIDMIEGLAFSGLTADDGTSSNGTLCLDWTNKAVWLYGTVTLPALLRGHTVKIASNAVPTAVAEGLTRMTSEETSGVYVYRATAAVASPTFTFSGSHIYSIEVSRTSIQLIFNSNTSPHLEGATPTLTLGTTNQYWGNYAFNVIPGINLAEYVPTASPTDILTIRNQSGSYMSNNGGSTGYNYLTLTGTTTGTAHITVTISPAGEHAFDIVGPYEFDVRVVQNAVPTKWEFENTGIWTTATAAALGADETNWQSGTAANEYKNKNKINGTELYVGETKMTETAGLYITAEKGAIQVNPTNGYVRLGNASRANIVIPNAVAEQTVTFKVKTATAGKECGIQAASSNLALISGTVAGDVSYYTFRVTNNGDIKFTQTSSDTDLFIYYIDLKAATPANTGLKFVHGSDDISNTKVNIVSGVTGALDSYFTLAKGGSVDWANVTVAVSPSSLITYDNDGTFTMGSGTGTATITARTTDSSVETGIAVLYVSVKNQPTVTLNYTQAPPYSVDYGQDFNGTSTVTGTSSASLPVKYKSSNERVATVDANGHVTCVGVGTATITAYTEETTNYLYAEASYDVTYNSGNVIFQFEPSEVKLALGKNITPFLHYDQKGQLDPASLNFTMSKSGIVTCAVVADAKQPDKNVIKITSVDDASKIGETVIVTASATMKNSSVVYNTTIAVTITAADAVNFDWVNGDDIYVYENTYFPIPGYNGNASGNNHFSNGPDNKSTYHAYYYSISNGSVTWNKENYKLNEGVPDYSIANDTGEALIFWGYSDNNLTGDTLLVFAKTAGTVKLHAVDSQSGVECTPITIHILAKSELDAAHNAELNTISFPYTWDFTKDISDNDFANSMFWEEDNQGRYTNTAAWMNQDWADVLSGITRYSINFMGGTGAGSPMALFKGMQIELGNTTFSSKIDRLRVEPTAGDGKAHLYVNGGPHTLTLPRPGYTNPNTGFVEPSNYQVIIKLKTTTNTEVNVNVNGTITTHTSKSDSSPDLDANVDAIISQNVASGQTVKLGIGNAYVYWIAFSTEKNKTAKPDENINLNGAATTYSYGKALDLAKSKEVNNGLTAYYASTFTNGVDAASAVTLRQVTLDQNGVRANTGLVLKSETPSTNYMIADAENKDSYTAPVALPKPNFLVAGDGSVVNSTTDSDEGIKTNFALSYAYKKFADDGITAKTGYLYDRDWSFYKVMPYATVPKGKAYLQVPGNLRVKPDGTIETVKQAGSRRAADGSNDDKPANKLMLDIVYEDEAHGFDATTAINDVKTDTVTVDDDAWYTIQGIRVNAPARGGIYIHNGKKVVIK